MNNQTIETRQNTSDIYIFGTLVNQTSDKLAHANQIWDDDFVIGNGTAIAGANQCDINHKLDKDIKNISERFNNLIEGAPAAYDTLKEISDYIASDKDAGAALTRKITELDGKITILPYISNIGIAAQGGNGDKIQLRLNITRNGLGDYSLDLPSATSDTAGVMPASDKKKLDSIDLDGIQFGDGCIGFNAANSLSQLIVGNGAHYAVGSGKDSYSGSWAGRHWDTYDGGIHVWNSSSPNNEAVLEVGDTAESRDRGSAGVAYSKGTGIVWADAGEIKDSLTVGGKRVVTEDEINPIDQQITIDLTTTVDDNDDGLVLSTGENDIYKNISVGSKIIANFTDSLHGSSTVYSGQILFTVTCKQTVHNDLPGLSDNTLYYAVGFRNTTKYTLQIEENRIKLLHE